MIRCRTNCVLCEHHNLIDIVTLYKYPITPSSNNEEPSSDEYNDCIFSNCSLCGTVQLKNLIDPIKLYKNSHNSTENTPTWKEHHSLFASFITDNSDTTDILEIGGNSGTLYRLLCNKIKNYSILDICPTAPTEVTFFQGNCEDFDFKGHTHVVLSHTFEHLYSPRKFIENLSKSRVKSVYISIPNMENLYSSKNISIIHNEHTFFIGDHEIKYIFSQYGYLTATSKEFINHSLFYHFMYNESIFNESIKAPVPNNMIRAKNIKNYISDFELFIKNINVSMPCYICPAGHYGQKIYYYLKQYHNNIIGFIDNDISKQGLRVYGTPKQVYSPNILKTHGVNIICVILYAGPYTKELQSQLNLLHDNIHYINI